MKKLFFILVLWIGTQISVFSGNYHDFVEIPQTILAEFSSSQSAEKVSMEICKLPQDKKISFTIRGDDTNGRHLALAHLLQKYGFKAGFLFNGIPASFEKTAKEIVQTGSSIGNHTRHHPKLPDLLPNSIYDEIVMHQIDVEEKSGFPSVSFTLPFCNASNPVDPNAVMYLAESLRRAGIFASTEGHNPYHFPKEVYFSSHRMRWFPGSDNNPDPEKMEKEYQNAVSIVRNHPDVPRISYGMHTSYSKEGLLNLEKWLILHRNDPDLWKCNENEYGGYRYSFYHARPGKKTENRKAIYSLTRLSASDLGSEIPLSVRFSEKPIRLLVDGKKIEPEKNGTYSIPAVGKIPEKIISCNSNGTSPLLPGMEFQLRFLDSENKLELRIRNLSNTDLHDLSLRFTAPLLWEKGVYRIQKNILKKGKEKLFTVDLGKRSDKIVMQNGDWNFLARCDFSFQGEQIRAYSSTFRKNSLQKQNCPRDYGIFAGPVSSDSLSPERLQQISLPSHVLKHLGSADHEKWRNYRKTNPDFREFVLNSSLPDSPEFRLWRKETNVFFQQKQKGTRLFLLDFTSKESGKGTLLCPSHPGTLSEFYLNGIRYPFLWKNKWIPLMECEIPIREGKNRILLVNPIKNDWLARRLGVSIAVRKDGKDLPFTEILSSFSH